MHTEYHSAHCRTLSCQQENATTLHLCLPIFIGYLLLLASSLKLHYWLSRHNSAAKLYPWVTSAALFVMTTEVFNLLEIPPMRTVFAQRSFTYSEPHIWNTLPHKIIVKLNLTVNNWKRFITQVVLTESRDSRTCDFVISIDRHIVR